MEKFQVYREDSVKKLNVADHLLLVTYPMIKDPKILLSVAQNLYNSLEAGVNAVLEHEILFKNIGVLPQSFAPRLDVFKKVAMSLGFSGESVGLVEKYRDVVVSHANSAVEFPRKDKFVISGDDYDLETLDSERLKEDIKKGKAFLTAVDTVVKKNERIFG